MKIGRILGVFLALSLLAVGAAWAANATDTKTLTITAAVTNSASLTIGGGAINFPNTDGDTASIPSNPATLPVEAKVKTGSASTVTLKVLANGDLVSTVPTNETISISKVTWTATNVLGSGLVAGTMSTAAGGVLCGSWLGSGKYTGTFSYFLANSWDLPVGAFTQTATYTLIAP